MAADLWGVLYSPLHCLKRSCLLNGSSCCWDSPKCMAPFTNSSAKLKCDAVTGLLQAQSQTSWARLKSTMLILHCGQTSNCSHSSDKYFSWRTLSHFHGFWAVAKSLEVWSATWKTTNCQIKDAFLWGHEVSQWGFKSNYLGHMYRWPQKGFILWWGQPDSYCWRSLRCPDCQESPHRFITVWDMAIHPPSYCGHRGKDSVSNEEATTTCQTLAEGGPVVSTWEKPSSLGLGPHLVIPD